MSLRARLTESLDARVLGLCARPALYGSTLETVELVALTWLELRVEAQGGAASTVTPRWLRWLRAHGHDSGSGYYHTYAQLRGLGYAEAVPELTALLAGFHRTFQ